MFCGYLELVIGISEIPTSDQETILCDWEISISAQKMMGSPLEMSFCNPEITA